jgi:hypothetical protein
MPCDLVWQGWGLARDREIMKDDGTMAHARPAGVRANHGLIGAITDLIHYRSRTERIVEALPSVRSIPPRSIPPGRLSRQAHRCHTPVWFAVRSRRRRALRARTLSVMT